MYSTYLWTQEFAKLTELNKFEKLLSSIFDENGSLCVQTHNNYASEKIKVKKDVVRNLPVGKFHSELFAVETSHHNAK